MFFTQEDIQKISKGLAELSIKDTQLPGTEEVLEQDCLAIVQDGKNKKVSVRDFLNNLGVLKKSDFINISALTDNTYNNIDEVVHEVPVNCRKPGLCVTFQDTDYNWKIYQFRGEANQWDVLTFWVDILDYSSYVVNGILPDEEDLTVSGKDEKDNLLLSLKDRKPSEDFVGKGYKILRRNIVKKQVTKTGILINKAATTTGTVGITISGITTMITLTTSDNTVEAVAKTIYDALIDNEKMSGFYITYESNTVFVENKFTLNSSISTVGKTSSGAEIYVNDEDIEVDKNILTQAAINQPNTIYEIRYDFDLYGAEIVIPEDCVLKFEGGSFKNGTLVGKNTSINASNTCIVQDIDLLGTINNSEFNTYWFGITPETFGINKIINKAISSIALIGGNLIFDSKDYYCNSTIWLKSRVGIIGRTVPSYYYTSKNTTTRFIFTPDNKGNTFYWAFDSDVFDKSTNQRIVYNKFHTTLAGNTKYSNSSYNLQNLEIYTVDKIFGGIRLITAYHSIIRDIHITGCKVGMYLTSSWGGIYTKLIFNTLIHGIVLGAEVTTECFDTIQCTRRKYGVEYLVPTENDIFGEDVAVYLYRPDIINVSKLFSYGIIGYLASITFNNITIERYDVGCTGYGNKFLFNTPYWELLTKGILYSRGGNIIELNPVGAQFKNYTEYEEYCFDRGAHFTSKFTNYFLRCKVIGNAPDCNIQVTPTSFTEGINTKAPQFYNSKEVKYKHSFTTVYVANTSENIGFGFDLTNPITIKEAIIRITKNESYSKVNTIYLVDDIYTMENLGDLRNLSLNIVAGEPKKLTISMTATDCKFSFTNIVFKLSDYKSHGLWYMLGNTELQFTNCSNDVSPIRVRPTCNLVLKEKSKIGTNNIYMYYTVHGLDVKDITFKYYLDDLLKTTEVVDSIDDINNVDYYANNAIIYVKDEEAYYHITIDSKNRMLLIPFNRSGKRVIVL